MTRDTQRLHEEHDLANDAEVYAALWAAAPFPRLPEDAPIEIKNLTIDVDDPKRVYAIYRASRRHHFQLLVERYIHQIRYGCQSKTCITKTCFSCRKRLAGGAPVRRYNATSARTLAIYMATQDNPEQGLCHNPSIDRPAPSINRNPKSKKGLGDVKTPRNRLDGSVIQSDDDNTPKTITAHTSNVRAVNKEGVDNERIRRNSGEDSSYKSGWANVQILEEPSRTDHRSFVQNVFGTVAFKMVEWLTPRNLKLLATVEENDNSSQDAVSPATSTQSALKDESAPSNEATILGKGIDPVPQAQDRKFEQNDASEGPRQKSSNLRSQSIPTNDTTTDSLSSPTSNTRPTPKRRSSHVRTSSDSIEPQAPKSILNLPPKSQETGNDMSHFSPGKPQPKQKVLRQAVITSPTMRVADSQLSNQVKPPTTKLTPGKTQKLVKVEDEKVSTKPSTTEDNPPRTENKKKRHAKLRRGRLNTDESPPQSLSYLPIEAIDLLCDIMQSDGTSEKHILHPPSVPEELRRQRDGPKALNRNPSSPAPSSYPQSAKLQWQAFIEQSIFDVLGKPDSLLRSFRHGSNRLFDSQTIWYLMLRMTRVAPSLVFDSLWSATGTLFRPPEKLEATHDWAKESPNQNTSSARSVSNHDAAQVINVCLHALVASAPLVHDARQLMNMSRIRSYGLAMLGRDSSSLEPVTLCLQYEDAFTNDSAMRLARRLFAAIPTRRRFTELLDLQNDVRDIEPREPDILETILETLKFLDLGMPPVLNFSKDERDLHETRVSTLILDWARTVMLQEWQGSAEVPSDGPFGGALTTMAAIYKNRKSLLLGDIHFRTEYFSERLDPVTMPREWLTFEQNKRTAHLLDLPYLFNPSTLVTYFRAINFSRMNHSYETAKATIGLMNTAMAGNHNLMADKQRRDRLIERLRTATSSFMVLEIRRTNVLVDTFNSIWRREERELMRPLKIRLGEDGGEEGLDSGGVQQEFFRLAIAEALNPDYGAFTIDSRTKMTWFQPGSPEPLWKFELIGTIISLAVYNGLTLPVTFPKALYRKLLDEDVTELHHIADGWPDLANGLTTLLEWDERDGAVEDIFARTYEFSVEQFGQPVSREMGTSTHWPQFSDPQPSSSNPDDAPLVTNENRNSYVSDYIRWLTDISILPQFEAFKSGFFACIDRRSVKLFDPETLQSVVEGIQEIDITEMRRTTRYVGWDASHKSIRDFWSIVKKFDMEQKRKLLEFVTASDRVPVGGMRNLQFTLQKNGVDDRHLPTSYTCYGILLLPEYSSKEVLKEKLAMALENSKGFGFA